MTYKEALEYIHGISWTFCKPGLERIEELCRGLGHPERALRFVHVAGTNGKGSFCSMLSSVLVRAGYKTGLFTSPYIYRFNERMRINGEDIPDEVLARITERVKPVAEAMRDKPTEFELITAIALEYFREAGCDVVVLEAGMGGRLDSTNVIRNPLLSVITGIALDHVAFLGDTTEKIAAEKAGIIKDGAPVLFGGTDEGAERVIRETAEARGSEFFKADYTRLSVESADLSGSVIDYKQRKVVKISLLGLYQPRNASLVLDACDILRTRGIELSEEDIYEGLSRAVWRARFEIIKENPTVIFDGAHNAEGISAAVESIKHYFKDRRVAVVSGVLSDKDYMTIAKSLSEVASRVFTVTPDNPRALSASDYARIISQHGVEATPMASVKEALEAALSYAEREGTAVFSLGSLYTYEEVIRSI